MADRLSNAELVIKARDETKAGLASVKKGLRELEAAQKRVADKAQAKTNLDSLAAEYRKAKAEATALGAALAATGGKGAAGTQFVADAFAEMRAEVVRTKAALMDAGAQLQSFQKVKSVAVFAGRADDLAKVAAETRRATAETARLTAEQEQAADAARRAAAEMRNAVFTRPAAAQAAPSSIASNQGLAGRLAEHQPATARLADAKKELGELQKASAQAALALKAADAPTQELVKEFEELRAKTAAAKANLADLTASLKSTGASAQSNFAAFSKSATAMNKVEVATEQAAVANEKLTRSLNPLARWQEMVQRQTAAMQTSHEKGFLGLRGYELQNLSYQINDVFTSLGSGTPVTQVFAQQSGQIAQLFPQVIAGFIAWAPAILAATAALAPFVSAFSQVLSMSESMDQFQAQLTLTADRANYSAEYLTQFVDQLGRTGVAADEARDIVRKFMEQGLQEGQMERFADASRDLAKIMGGDLSDAADDVAKAFTGTYDDVAELDSKLNFLTSTERDQIKAMFESGDAAGARTKAFEIFYGLVEDGSSKMDGPWSQAVDNFSSAWANLTAWLRDSSVVRGAIELIGQLAAGVNTLSGLLGKGRAALNDAGSGGGGGGAGPIDPAAAETDGAEYGQSWAQSALKTVSSVMTANAKYLTLGPLALLGDMTAEPAPAAGPVAPRGNGNDTINTASQAETKELVDSLDAALDKADEAAAKELEDWTKNTTDIVTKANKEVAEVAEKKIEAQDKFNASLAQEAADRQKNAELSVLAGREQAGQMAMYEAQKKARADGLELSQEQLDLAYASATAEYDALESEKKRNKEANKRKRTKKEETAEEKKQKEFEEQLNSLLEQRKTLMEAIAFYNENGRPDTASKLKDQLIEVDGQLKTTSDNFVAFLETLKSTPEIEALKTKFENLFATLETTSEQAAITGEDINSMIAEGAVDGVENFFEHMREGQGFIRSMGMAFRQFAAEFLIEIGRMILMQTILNALQGKSGSPNGGVGGSLASAISGMMGAKVQHNGALYAGAQTRLVDPAVFANAQRWHDGGLPGYGIKSDEYAGILKKDEEVLTRDDPRHVLNGGTGQSQANVKVVNLFDPTELLAAAMQSEAGQQVIMNYVRGNSSAVKAAINS